MAYPDVPPCGRRAAPGLDGHPARPQARPEMNLRAIKRRPVNGAAAAAGRASRVHPEPFCSPEIHVAVAQLRTDVLCRRSPASMSWPGAAGATRWYGTMRLLTGRIRPDYAFHSSMLMISGLPSSAGFNAAGQPGSANTTHAIVRRMSRPCNTRWAIGKPPDEPGASCAGWKERGPTPSWPARRMAPPISIRRADGSAGTPYNAGRTYRVPTRPRQLPEARQRPADQTSTG